MYWALVTDRAAINALIPFEADCYPNRHFIQTIPPTCALLLYAPDSASRQVRDYLGWNRFTRLLSTIRMTPAPAEASELVPPQQFTMLIIQGEIPALYVRHALQLGNVHRAVVVNCHINFQMPQWITRMTLMSCTGDMHGQPFPVLLKHLKIENCYEMMFIDIAACSMLTSLHIDSNGNIEEIPYLPRLIVLHVARCDNLRRINSWPVLQRLHIDECRSLQFSVEDAAGSPLTSLTYYNGLHLNRPRPIRYLPDAIASFSQLRTLDISLNTGLQGLPRHIGSLHNLRDIVLPAYIDGITQYTLPRSFMKLHRLSAATIRHLPFEVAGGSANLKELNAYINKHSPVKPVRLWTERIHEGTNDVLTAQQRQMIVAYMLSMNRYEETTEVSIFGDLAHQTLSELRIDDSSDEEDDWTLAEADVRAADIAELQERERRGVEVSALRVADQREYYIRKEINDAEDARNPPTQQENEAPRKVGRRF